jgi:hypothetical protein
MAKLDTICSEISRWLSVLAIVLLGHCGVILVVAWVQASHDGRIPEKWGESDGNHGPWRHYYPGRSLVGQAILTPFWALCASAGAFVARPSERAVGLMIVCLSSLLLVSLSHFWLVD